MGAQVSANPPPPTLCELGQRQQKLKDELQHTKPNHEDPEYWMLKAKLWAVTRQYVVRRDELDPVGAQRDWWVREAGGVEAFKKRTKRGILYCMRRRRELKEAAARIEGVLCEA